MPRIGFHIDANYRRIADQATTFRDVVRARAHQPERRATTRTLFYTGAATLVIAGVMAFFFA
jgi:hypothetical protein